MHTIRAIAISDSEIEVEELDILHNTPVLDIKPYVPLSDAYPQKKAGWFDAKKVDTKTADDRFIKK